MENLKPLLTFKIEKDGVGFHALCMEFGPCHIYGETVPIALENLKAAVQLHLDAMMEEEFAKLAAEMLAETQ